MSRRVDSLDSASVLIDIVSAAGRIVYANRTQERLLGFKAATLSGKKADRIYSPEARALLARLAAGELEAPASTVRMQLRTVDGDTLKVLSQLEILEDKTHGRCVRSFKFACDDLYARLERLESDNEVLSSIITTARDASFCVEFLEPVDLTAPDHEVVRQVFENQCIWRYCNESMAQLYKLPLGDDLNKHDVRDVFPHNPDNEEFVRRLIESGWRLDGALSRDHRYDGVDVFIENDVRADIRHGQLHRFWGTVRDPRARRMREKELEHQVSGALDILGALPDPVIVVNEQGRIEGANSAVEWKLGWRLDSVLGASVDRLVDVGMPSHELVAAARLPSIAGARPAHARCRDGRLLGCHVVLAEVGGESGPPRCAAILRFATGPDELLDGTTDKGPTITLSAE